MMRDVVRLIVVVLLVVAVVFYARWQKDQVNNAPIAQPVTCVNNLKRIGLAFRSWSINHDNSYPFNVSTNDGGTREFCARAPDGFDSNVAFHFQVMTNQDELNTPALLICPKDRIKKPAPDFPGLTPANLTYRLRTGVGVDEAHPNEILAVCPIDGNTLYCDGHVLQATKN